MRVSSLYIVLKDHANESLQDLFSISRTRVLRRKASEEGIETEKISFEESSPLLLKNMDEKVATELIEAVKSLSPFVSLKLVNKSGNGKPRTVLYDYFFIFSVPKIIQLYNCSLLEF